MGNGKTEQGGADIRIRKVRARRGLELVRDVKSISAV
jgi:hypothetical protein